MGIRTIAGVILGVLHAAVALAQSSEEMPPLSLAPPPKSPVGPVMPGVVVSQALQSPAEIPPAPLPIPVATPGLNSGQRVIAVDSARAPVRWWGNAEYLIWWPKQQPLIPLLTGNNDGFIPVVGSPGTAVLIGNSSVKTLNVPGGRFSLGANLGGQYNFGIEANYFFLGTQNSFYSSGGFPQEAYSFLGIPFVDPSSNQEDSYSLRTFRDGGSLNAFTSTRVTGWEALFSMSLYEMPGFRIQGLLGYRYFLANEGLQIQVSQNDTVFDQDFQLFNQSTLRYDEVNTSNRFHGGTLGTRTNIALGAAGFFELDSKISIGNVKQVVQRSGGNIVTTEGNANPVVTDNSGIFVQPSNAGKYVNTLYAFVPETGMKLGFNYGPAKVYFGYNVIYLSQAARPSDQLDRTLELNQLANGFPGTFNRPSNATVSNDFWVQGVSFGLELSY